MVDQEAEVVEMEENEVPPVQEMFQSDDELQGVSHEVQASDVVETTEVIPLQVDDMASQVVCVQIQAANVVQTEGPNAEEVVQAAYRERVQTEVVGHDEVMQVDEVTQADNLLGLSDSEVGTHS